MRLQSESRRISRGTDLNVDLSRANTLSFAAPPSAKRMSFTPLTGTSAGRVHNHRRVSSVSDSNVILGDVANGLTADTSPNPQTTALPDVSTQPGIGTSVAFHVRIHDPWAAATYRDACSAWQPRWEMVQMGCIAPCVRFCIYSTYICGTIPTILCQYISVIPIPISTQNALDGLRCGQSLALELVLR
jgi:hypothetical protein